MRPQSWIKAALKSKGQKLKDVAEALNIPSSRVTDILQGKREVQADELAPLAELLSMGVQSLLKSLEDGEQVHLPGDGQQISLPVLGSLNGNGTLTSAPEGVPKSIPLPIDATSAEGLSCYIMGDSSMAQEIKEGDIVIAADPRIHFYPMTPGGIFLVSGPSGTLAPRQYMQSDTGESWLVALPLAPDPTLENWRFSMLPDTLTGSATNTGHGNSENTSVSATGTENQGQRIVYTSDIAAAVVWVHRRYMP